MTPLADPETLPSQKVLAALDAAGMDMAAADPEPAGPLDTDIRRMVSEMMLAWRKAHGMTQKDAAGYTEIPLQTWRKWERMERTCPYPRLMALALLRA
jgi:DNA-binding XRE family transcriptional regulator